MAFKGLNERPDDLLDDESTTTVDAVGGARESTVHENDSDNNEERGPRRALLPLSELLAKLEDFEKASVEGCVTDAVRTICKLRSIFVSAKMEEARKSIGQLLITDLRSRKCSLIHVPRHGKHL